jgi:ATP-dependent helicase/nuclease subunit B
VTPEHLLSIDMLPELAEHWQDSLRLFARVQVRWQFELDERGQVDAPVRRNLLLAHAAQAWRAAPPAFPIIAAGVTSAAPAIARLLRTVADLPEGAVVLPDLDLALEDEVWTRWARPVPARNRAVRRLAVATMSPTRNIT